MDAAIQKLDVATIFKASQAVSREIELPKLVERLMTVTIENAGADRGLLALLQKEDYRVKATAEVSGGEIVLRQASNFSGDAPDSLIRHVMRTQQSVILGDARRPRSVFCLPLLRQNALTGVLYLENTLTSDVFSSDRTGMLGLLASQIAISLENTRLYSDLREREAKIRRLVDANIIGILIWDFDGKIIEANDAFLRIVGYDREDLTSGRLNWADLTPPEWFDRHEEEWLPALRMTGSVHPFEKEYFRRDGSRVPVLVGAATFEDGGDRGVAFVLDLTERKRSEQAVR